jgi:hypothetical protein
MKPILKEGGKGYEIENIFTWLDGIGVYLSVVGTRIGDRNEACSLCSGNPSGESSRYNDGQGR